MKTFKSRGIIQYLLQPLVLLSVKQSPQPTPLASCAQVGSNCEHCLPDKLKAKVRFFIHAFKSNTLPRQQTRFDLCLGPKWLEPLWTSATLLTLWTGSAAATLLPATNQILHNRALSCLEVTKSYLWTWMLKLVAESLTQERPNEFSTSWVSNICEGWVTHSWE